MKLSQSAYFDSTPHQFSLDQVTQPFLFQTLEMDHIRQALSLPPSSSIIDFGCGSGRASIYFLRHGYHVHAVDISHRSLNNLTRIYRQFKKPSWGKLTTSDHLFPGQFSAIIGSDILHHVNLKEVLPQLYLVLAPGGKIVFSEPNALNITWYFHYLLKHVPWHIESGILQCNLPYLYSVLRQSGFRQIELSGHGLFPTRLFNSFPRLCYFNCFKLGNNIISRPFAFRYLISAQK